MNHAPNCWDPRPVDFLFLVFAAAFVTSLVWVTGCAHMSAQDALKKAQKGLSIAGIALDELADAYCDAALDDDRCAEFQRKAEELGEDIDAASDRLEDGSGIARELDSAAESVR